LKIVSWDEKHGKMLLEVENRDDLWCLYNVLNLGDFVTARTLREVKVDDKSSRKPMTLKVRVEKVEFQPYTSRLRIRGVVIEGPDEFGVVGSYHSISVGEGSQVLIEKERWSKHELDRIFKASSKRPLEVLLIGIDSDEVAFVLPHDYGLELVAEARLDLPGKHELSKREEVLKGRIREISGKVKELVQRLNLKAVAIVGPGFVKDYLAREVASSANVRVYVDSASTGGYQGVKEAIRRGILRRMLKDFDVVEEVELMDELLLHVSRGDGKAAYGLEDVRRAAECGAVDKLLVLDELVRSPDPELRSKVEEVMDIAEKRGAKIKIFSSLEEPGQQLKSMGGLAAILRYGLSFET
jgi:protein pelota